MNNIVIYSTKPMPELEAILADIDEVEVRTVDIKQVKDYAVVDPSLMIIEDIELAKDALMTNKFPCPILFLGKSRRDFTVRAEGFDFIENYKNKDELIIRANALLKIKTIKDRLEKVRKAYEENGFEYTSDASVKREQFPTRVYGDLELEKGFYDALIVELGDAKGDNWWCVIYPPLCFAGGNLTAGNIKYKSKILEIINEWKTGGAGTR